MGNAAAGRKPPVHDPALPVDFGSGSAHAVFMIRFLTLALFATLTLFLPAQAGDNSAVVNYPVKGDTAKAIYNDIKVNSPKIAPNATFAYTAIATKTVKSHKVAGGACSYKRFETSAIYNFVIPKREGAKPLSKPLTKTWNTFTAYLQKHEEGHREIWRNCLAEYDQSAMTLSAKNCEALDKAREALFTSIKLRCVQQDEAYDVIFRKQVVNHPFVREALRGPTDNRN